MIPEMRVQWWDVEADAPRTAVIPARTLSVAPAPVSAAAIRPALAAPSAAPEAGARPWQIASAALALAWLATLGVLVRTRGRRRGIEPRAGTPAGESPPSASAARQRVLDACNASDPREARRALLGWAGLAWPGSPPRDLIAVAARVRDERFGEAIMALDRALWSGGDAVWNGRSMAALLPREIGPRLRPGAAVQTTGCRHCTLPDAESIESPNASSCSFISIQVDSIVEISSSSFPRRTSSSCSRARSPSR